MWSTKGHSANTARRDRFPTEWALDYGDEDEKDPIKQAQPQENARLEDRISSEPRIDTERVSSLPVSNQFG